MVNVPIEFDGVTYGYVDAHTYNSTLLGAKLLTSEQLEKQIKSYLVDGPVQYPLPSEFFILYKEWRTQFPDKMFAKLMYG